MSHAFGHEIEFTVGELDPVLWKEPDTPNHLRALEYQTQARAPVEYRERRFSNEPRATVLVADGARPVGRGSVRAGLLRLGVRHWGMVRGVQ